MSSFVVAESPVLAGLRARALASDLDRPAWLLARTNCVTATEAKLLVTARDASARLKVIAELVRDKRGQGTPFHGNMFTHWGNLREPVIIDQLRARYQMETCGLLIASDSNVRHAATPDAWRVNFDGCVDLAEIKTSKNDMRYGSDHFVKAGYELQMQWQMRCTGAARVLYVLEAHDNDFSRWDPSDRSTWLLETGPAAAELYVHWVERDDAVIAEMIAYADQALAALDSASDDEVPEVLQSAVAAAIAAKVDAATAAAAEVQARDRVAVLARAAGLSTVKLKTPAGSLSWGAGVDAEVDAPDLEAAQVAHAKEWAQLERAQKRVESLKVSWDALAAGFTKKVAKPGCESLRITPAKAKAVSE